MHIVESLVMFLKKMGANEIHIRISSPPVIDICELGIAIDKPVGTIAEF